MEGTGKTYSVASVLSDTIVTGSINLSSLKCYSKGIHQPKPNKT